MRINQIVTPINMNTQYNSQQVKKIDFGELLSNAIDKVDQSEKVSQNYNELIATGEVENLHDAMIAAQKAEVTLSFALEIRTKVLEAYQELMRLQV